ncbi:MAG: NAD(P)/FAD-dependent oxidoreductase, partial [Bacilli bacterium]|nr:NAD(P)/FAD-dependent oxidoreductase [Bacilli bacterium]
EYPVSESAITVRNQLLKQCRSLGIKININEKLIDYQSIENKVSVLTNAKSYTADKLIIAAGGKSSPKLGSDGSIFNILKNHGLNIVSCNPGLCPIETKESTKALNGIRIKSNVSLIINNKVIHQESGEVLFKEHGLSGIVIFNLANHIASHLKDDCFISLDMLEGYTENEIADYIRKHGEQEFLNAFFHPTLIEYINTNHLNPLNVKSLRFTFKNLDGYEHSQVTIGGLDISEVNDSLESTKEKNVYFVGEVLDINGPCGGYNLTWAFASALSIN